MPEFQDFLATVSPKLQQVINGFMNQVETCETPLVIEWRQLGFELRVAAQGDKPAGRPRIFVFKESADKAFAFFYKPSRLSFSKDRFSYGLLAIHRGATDDALTTLKAGLEFLEADFRPALRPQKLGRIVNITVPRD
ncbi:MAG: hypothetical protein ACI97A_002168 [Planctomycetota bacterium]|jgi:hypothetical protein